MTTPSLTTQLGTSASLADGSDVLVRKTGHSGLQIASTYIFISGQGESNWKAFCSSKIWTLVRLWYVAF